MFIAEPARGAPRAESAPAPLVVAVPPDRESAAVTSRALTLGDERVGVLVELAGATNYVFVVALGVADPAPELLLRGSVGGKEVPRVELRVESTKQGDRVLVTDVSTRTLCGRPAPAKERVLDAAHPRFSAVYPSALSNTEQAAAPTLTARAAEGVIDLVAAVLVEPGGEPRAESDGIQGVALPPYAAFEVALPAAPAGRTPDEVVAPGPSAGAPGERKSSEGAPPGPSAGAPPQEKNVANVEAAGPRRLAIAIAPNAAPGDRQLWLLVDGVVQGVQVPSDANGFVTVDVAESARCVAVVQGAARWVSEVGWVGDAPEETSGQLARRLGAPDDRLARRRLLARGEDGARAVASEVPTLGPSGRRAARDLARVFAPSIAGAIWVPLLGDELRELSVEAEEELTLLGDDGVRYVDEGAALGKSTRAVALPLLARLEPARAARRLVEGLNLNSPAERLLERRRIAELSADAALRLAVEKLFVLPEASQSPRRVRAELARALEGRLPELSKEARAAIVQLVRTARYQEAYRNTGVALALLPETLPTVQGWLDGDVATKDPKERAALRRWVLTSLAERQVNAPGLGASILARASDREVRVREAAVDALVIVPAKDGTAALSARLSKDDWPEVRRAAARVLGSYLGQKGAPAEIEAKLVHALRRDGDVGVRATAALSLGQGSGGGEGESSRDALIRALKKDDASAVRGAAAHALAARCETEALDALTGLALELGRSPGDEAVVDASLEAAVAIAKIAPGEVEKRLAPLRGKVEPQLEGRLDRQLEAVRTTCTLPKQVESAAP